MLNIRVAVQSFWMELNHFYHQSLVSSFKISTGSDFWLIVNFKHSKEPSRTIPKVIPVGPGGAWREMVDGGGVVISRSIIQQITCTNNNNNSVLLTFGYSLGS